MNQSEQFAGLRIPRRPQAGFHISRRATVLLATPILFSLLWLILPHNVLYWLLLPLVSASMWMASYGWRWAVADLRRALERLETM